MTQNETIKVCSMCKEGKTLENFQRDKKGKFGVRARCKACCSIIRKQQYQENKDKVAEYNKKRYAENREAIKEGQKRYYEEHKEQIKAKARKWGLDNPDRKAERNARYRKEKPELHQTRQKRYITNNPERVRELRVKHSQTRRARMRELVSDLTDIEWLEALEHFNNSCAYCGKTDCKLEQEHVIPVSGGGGYTKSNIIPSCKSCNVSKHDNELIAWYQKQDSFTVDRLQKIIEFSDYHVEELIIKKLLGF